MSERRHPNTGAHTKALTGEILYSKKQLAAVTRVPHAHQHLFAGRQPSATRVAEPSRLQAERGAASREPRPELAAALQRRPAASGVLTNFAARDPHPLARL